MSWIEDVKTDFLIETGDGNKFTPSWLNASKSVEYNISEFNFPNVPGSLVIRKQPKGRRYNIEIYFKGSDHLIESNSFETSANDSRAWTISHPFYDRIIVQPVGLNFDNTKYNITKITGSVIETITEDYPKSIISPVEKIESDKIDLDTTFENSFENDVIPDTNDITSMGENADVFYNAGAKIVKETSNAEKYLNKYNDAKAKILNAGAKPLIAINALQALINEPAIFAQSVKVLINMYVSQITQIGSQLTNIFTPSGKKIYENNVGVALSGMMLAASNPQPGDYSSRSKVVEIIDEITVSYNTYIAALDTLQSDNGGDESSYIPDIESLSGLNNLVNFTLSNLFNITLETKQERSIILESDSNIILLAHRFYGLQVDDTTMDDIIDINDIGINEMLLIEKGRKIIYLV